jgi:hypothetical protein
MWDTLYDECPWFRKLLKLRPKLLDFIESDPTSELKTLAWMLLVISPRNPVDLIECESPQLVPKKNGWTKSAQNWKYIHEIISKLLTMHDYSVVFPVLLKHIADREIFYSALKNVDSDQMEKCFQNDSKLIDALSAGFIGEAVRFCKRIG